jgi:hypothetical protein
MQEPDRVAAIFADAWALYADAIEIRALGKQRIAAEAAWGATKRATDALILIRTGQEPTSTGQTTRGIGNLGRADASVAPLARLYNRRIVRLHGRCFYTGNCGEVADLIEDTSDYIRDAEGLASSGAEV